MKIEQMIIGGGLALVFGVSMVAIIADDLFEDEYHDAPAITAASPTPLSHKRDGRDKIVCNSCHVILPPKAGGGTPPIVFDAPTPASHKRDGRDTMVCQKCHKILPSKTGGGGRSENAPPIAFDEQTPLSHKKDGRSTMVCQNCHKIMPR